MAKTNDLEIDRGQILCNRFTLAFKHNRVVTTAISSYSYTVNHLGQRTGVSTAGTAFAASGTIDWGYNNKGEVVKADSSVNAADRAYQYDGIGNRLKSADALTLPTSNNYTPNALNQYEAIGSLSPGYDFDGNMTSGPLPANQSANSTLVWDAENRLISTTVNSVTTTYLYDSQSRRIAQTTGAATTVYVYDGWNPIGEYSGTTLSKTYTWGMDLSGSMQGAGGVGGLLAVTDSMGICYPTYDGNGNISEYLDATGVIAAHYEYDPFGRETVANGTNPTGFAHRFSTKPVDSVTGLLYYGYRWYDPVTGRWPSRDPIEEEGGINLYGMVINSVVNLWDMLGLTEFTSANMTEGDWSHVGGGSRDILQSEGGPILRTTGGQSVGAAVYVGANRIPDDAKKCGQTEIQFDYLFSKGDNSGFHFSIPSGAISSAEAINSEGIEVQLVSTKLDNDNVKGIKNRKIWLDGGKDREHTTRGINFLKDITRFEDHLTGSLYKRKPRDGQPSLNYGWNTMKVVMKESKDGNGLEIVVSINERQVNRHIEPHQNGQKRGHGSIAFQAHNSTKVVALFKNIKWKLTSKSNSSEPKN